MPNTLLGKTEFCTQAFPRRRERRGGTNWHLSQRSKAMKTHFWQSTRVAGSRRWRLARLRATIPLVVLGLVYVLTLGGLPEAAGGLPGYFTDVKLVPNVNGLPGDPHFSMGSRISRDGLEMYFIRAASRARNLILMMRISGSRTVTARQRTLANHIDSATESIQYTEEHMGSISSDGLTLYFGRRIQRDLTVFMWLRERPRRWNLTTRCYSAQ